MNKEDILKALSEKTEKELTALYIISSNFNESELTKIAGKVQKPATKTLILNYL